MAESVACTLCGAKEAREAHLIDEGGGSVVYLCEACLDDLDRSNDGLCARCERLIEEWTTGRDATLFLPPLEEGAHVEICPRCRRELLDQVYECRRVGA